MTLPTLPLHPYSSYENMRNLLMVDNPTGADPDYLLCGDLKQAELMIVAWLANETNLISLFKAGKDVHTINASLILKIPIDKIRKYPERYIGKKTGHAADYGLGAETYSDQILEETDGELYLSKSMSGVCIETYHSLYPNIRRNYHSWVQRTLKRCRIICTPPPFNRVRIFHGRLSEGKDGAFGEGYAYIPQSVGSADIASRAAEILDREGWWVWLHAHDELVLHVKRSQLVPAFRAMQKAMLLPIVYWPTVECAFREPLIIPVEYGVCQKYGEKKEVKGERDEEIEEKLAHWKEAV
jgi:hypothetical protein